MIKKKQISILLTLIIAINTLLPVAYAENFSDISGHWAEDQIQTMNENGIVNAYPDGTFKPDNNMTKAEFYKVINHLMGFEAKVQEMEFKDIDDTDWYYEEVAKALARGYIKDGEYLNPNDPISREEVARIIGFVYDLEKDAASARYFSDNISISIAARGYVGALKVKGLIQGYPDGTFGPQNNITRAEAITMLSNIVEAEGIPEIEEEIEEKKPTKPATTRPYYGGGGGGGGGRDETMIKKQKNQMY